MKMILRTVKDTYIFCPHSFFRPFFGDPDVRTGYSMSVWNYGCSVNSYNSTCWSFNGSHVSTSTCWEFES